MVPSKCPEMYIHTNLCGKLSIETYIISHLQMFVSFRISCPLKSEMATLNHFSEIAASLLGFFEKEFLCDTILITRSKQLKAHSILLAAVSPVFRTAFEENSCPGLQYIDLSSFETETVEIALNFIYTGKLLLPVQYAHVGKLPQLFATLKDLGLEAQRLHGCEIRFLR